MPNPTIVGVRVHLHDARTNTHDHGRRWYAEEDGYLRVTDDRADDVAVYAAETWAWAELVHGQDPDPARLTIPSTMWPSSAYVPLNPPTDDPVEQAKHEAAEHIGAARRIEAEKIRVKIMAAEATVESAQLRLSGLYGELREAQGEAA